MSRILGVPPALRPVWGLDSSTAVFQAKVDGGRSRGGQVRQAKPKRGKCPRGLLLIFGLRTCLSVSSDVAPWILLVSLILWGHEERCRALSCQVCRLCAHGFRWVGFVVLAASAAVLPLSCSQENDSGRRSALASSSLTRGDEVEGQGEGCGEEEVSRVVSSEARHASKVKKWRRK